MKVCTDSCLFAALVAREGGLLAENSENFRILDPGCGTGLLSLMMAQTFPNARISGIENHPGSAADCRENFRNSPWSDRLHLMEDDFTSQAQENKFRLIICNPPFFLSHLASPDSGRSSAMHTDREKFSAWLQCLKICLEDDGKVWLLLSSDAGKKVLDLIPDFTIRKRIQLIREPDTIWREIFCLTLQPQEAGTHISIKVLNQSGNLNETGAGLMSGFYR